MALSIVTLNANGLRDQFTRAGLLQWFRSLTVVLDIVCYRSVIVLCLLYSLGLSQMEDF